jgi:NAD(P)-dependent dehydrogenase (short-subunit alcohol dehydrogenase family)
MTAAAATLAAPKPPISAQPLSDAVIAVTGTGRGFGHSIARALGLAGATVMAIDADAEAASGTAAELERLGIQSIPIKGDCTVQLDVTNVYNKILEIYGSLTGLVHVADSTSATPFKRLMESEFVELIEGGAMTSYLMLQALQRRAPGAWATLVLPPSSVSEPQTRGLRAYLSGLVGGLSDAGMRCNALVPSRGAGGVEFDARLGESALALALPAARGITGQTVHVTLSPLPDLKKSIPREFLE